MARRKVKTGENPWGQCLTRLVPNGCRCSAFWLGRKTQKFSGTNTPESSAEHALFITQPNQEPSVDGRTTSTTSIINDHTFSSSNAVIHTLYQQFRVIDPEYAKISRFYTRLTSHSATGSTIYQVKSWVEFELSLSWVWVKFELSCSYRFYLKCR